MKFKNIDITPILKTTAKIIGILLLVIILSYFSLRGYFLNKAIDKLAANQKAAFTLHKYEDLSYKEIAEILDTSVSSVESLMHRAKKNLQNHIVPFHLHQMIEM